MSGYVTIPRGEIERLLDDLSIYALRLSASRRSACFAWVERLNDALADDPVDSGDPAANDTRPDPELLAALREAVRVQGLTVHATLYGLTNPTTGRQPVIEVEPLLPVLAIPAHGCSVTLTSGARGRVMYPPAFVGNAVKIKLAAMGREEE